MNRLAALLLVVLPGCSSSGIQLHLDLPPLFGGALTDDEIASDVQMCEQLNDFGPVPMTSEIYRTVVLCVRRPE